MIEIIQSQWFPSSSRIKGDAEMTTRMLEQETVPLSMIFLTLTAVCISFYFNLSQINVCFVDRACIEGMEWQ